MGLQVSCMNDCDFHGIPIIEFSRRVSVASLTSDTSRSSTSTWSDEEEQPLPVICGFGGEELKRFHWVPPKGWDQHAQNLGISARNNLHWDGRAPLPIAPIGGKAWLLPCSDKLSLRIAKLHEKLKSCGWKIITSPVHVIESLGNKANLPGYAARIGMVDFLPRHFAVPESAVYPCVLKPCQGEFGKDSYICNSKDEVYKYAPEFSPKKWVLQELVPGHVEFSVSLLVSHGSIMDVVGMRYTYDRSVYIWPNVVEVQRELCLVPLRHVNIMARFLQEYDGILNFNYKQRPDGRICIFEVNTRIGADLGCDAPRDRARQLFQLLDRLRS